MRRAVWESRLVLIVAVAMVALIVLAVTAVVSHRGEWASANEPQAEEPSASLGIDLIHCPKAEPEELPLYALASATEAALDQVPLVFGHVAAYVDGKAQTSEGAYAFSAQLTGGEFASRPGIIRDMCRERPQYAQRLLGRSVEVNIFSRMWRARASLNTVCTSRSLRTTTGCTRSGTDSVLR